MLRVAIPLAAMLASAMADGPTVTFSQGTIRGQVLTSLPNGKPFDAYYGIPYGQPTGGDARFRNPEPAEPWDGERDGTRDTYFATANDHVCAAPNMGNIMSGSGNPVTGGEDCLNLGVFVPQSADPSDPLPVMVFIHGGAFALGDYYTNGPHRYMDTERVIMVMMNYRLGVFGFLCASDDSARGNMGLRDQSMGIQWVKDNIADFGGDPERITIMGQSAGSASITYHVDAAEDVGRFQQAIAQSGSVLSGWGSQHGHPDLPRKHFNQALDCGADDGPELVDCLRSKTTEELIMAQATLGFPTIQPNLAPCIQTNPAGDQYLAGRPEDIITRGTTANPVPLLTGSSRDEGAFFFGTILETVMGKSAEDPSYLENDAIPAILNTLSDPRADDPAAIQAIKDQFFEGIDFSSYEETLPGLYDFVGATIIKEAVTNFALANAGAVPDATYLYSFEYVDTTWPSFDSFLLPGLPLIWGVGHLDILEYEWVIAGMDITTDAQQQVSDNIINTFVNFAVTGNPLDGDTPVPIGDNTNYIKITEDITQETDFLSNLNARALF